MRCAACNAEIRYLQKRQIKVPHPTRKGKLTIIHVDETLCRRCITISDNFSNGYYTEDEDSDISSLGIDIPDISIDDY